MPRVYTTMDKDSNKESVKHLQDEEKKEKKQASPLKTRQATQISPTKIEEKPEITLTLTCLKPGGRKLPAQVNHSEAKDHNQLLQLVAINPEAKTLHKLATLNQEETDTSSNLIAKPNPSAVQLHEPSIHSGLWNTLQCLASIFSPNLQGKFPRIYT